MTLHIAGFNDPSSQQTKNDWVWQIYDDDSQPGDWTTWRSLLDTASTVIADVSQDAGLSWNSWTINLDKTSPGHARAILDFPNKYWDGVTEYLVRLTIDGVQYPPINIRLVR